MARGSAEKAATDDDLGAENSARRWSRRALMVGLVVPFAVDGALLLAGRGGLFGPGPGVAIRELAIGTAMVGVLTVNGRTLRGIESERLRALDSLRAAHESLQGRVAEQARVEEELRESERRYRFLADAVPQMVWTARGDGGTDYFNRRWTEFTGQSLDEAREWGWLPVIHPDDLDRCTRRWRQAFESGERYDIEYRFRRADGVYRWQLGRADAMRDESGRVVRWFGTCTDIDDQKRVEAELRQIQEGLAGRVAERTAALESANLALQAEAAERKHAKEAAQAASRAKGEFLANMSHEIRTPMNGILGMIELTLQTEQNPTQREHLQIVASSANALLTVINDILDFSKIEAGKLELDPVAFSPRDALADTLRSLALRAHEKGIGLSCRVAPEVPRSVVGDPGRLRQILVNLIGNAIKFTERGEVVVAVEAGADPARPDRLRFAISDTGIGIPAAKREAIFAAFEQADGSTTRRYGGTGLGLAISAKLVELMGGTIRAEENPGGGSRFRFDAHFAPDRAAPAQRAISPRPIDLRPIALEGLRVLLADVNAGSRRVTGEILTRWGCRPVAVADAEETWDELLRAAHRDDPYVVLLLDLGMAAGGLRLVARLRARESASDWGRERPRVKVLMMTSDGTSPPDRAGADGVDGWLPRPLRASELLNALLDLLERGAAPPAAVHPTPDQLPSPPASPVTGPALAILLAEDHPINQRVALRMLEDLGHRVTLVADGRAAVRASAGGRFDLILMDVQMPELDGFEALAAIRQRELLEAEAEAEAAGHEGEGPAAGHLPIIALTAHAMTGDRERCFDAGFDDYLSKPVQPTCLRAALTPYLVIAARHAPPPPAVPPAAGAARTFDRSAALDAMGGDEALLDEIIRLFLDDTPRLLAKIRVAGEQSDHPLLAHLGHTLAGGASNLGLGPVAAAARRVERVGKHAADLAEIAGAIDHVDHAFEAAWTLLMAEVGTYP